jgi:hypothetical protein
MKTSMSGLFLAAMCVLAVGPWAPRAHADVPRIIIDQDMSSDHDDAADLAVLNALADLGECEILACVSDSRNGATALCMNAINTYYGRPNVPCARRPDSGGPGEYPGIIISEFSHPLYATWQDPPLALDLYRQVLAAQPDHSVSIVTTGYLNNLEELLKSGPDKHSSLNGMDLVRRKVKLLSCAGGCYPKGDEFNFRVVPDGACYVVNNWPTAAMYVGYDVGHAVYSGQRLPETSPKNPVRRAWDLTFWGPYPTWGQIAVHYAVRGFDDMWDAHTVGRNNCNAQGSNWWTEEPDPKGDQDQGYIMEKVRYPAQMTIDTLVTAPPKSGPPSRPGQPTNVRATVVGKDRIDLKWTDNAYNEDGFRIERKVDGVFKSIATVGPNVTRYSDKGLSSTANVAYRIKAYNAVGESDLAPITVFSGWTEVNFTTPSQLPLYTFYQYDNLLPNMVTREARPDHVILNNDSRHGRELTVEVQADSMGGAGTYYVYFFYQDADNWYRLSVNESASKFEKRIKGTTSPVGAAGKPAHVGAASIWRIQVARSGILTFGNDGTEILNVSDPLGLSSGKIGLGGKGSAPVWQNFSFGLSSTAAGGSAPLAPTAVNATANEVQVHVTWVGGRGSKTYNLYRGAAPNAIGKTPIATGIVGAAYNDITAGGGTTYFYKVKGINVYGTSPQSAEGRVTTPGTASTTNLIDNGAYQITAKSSKLAMSAKEAKEGAAIVQDKYTGAPTQQWSVENLGNNVVVLKLAGTGQCLEVPRASTGAGTALGVGTYSGKSHQQWKLVSVDGGFYEIINANSVLQANVNFNAMVPAIAISQWSVGNYANGVWAFTPVTAKKP